MFNWIKKIRRKNTDELITVLIQLLELLSKSDDINISEVRFEITQQLEMLKKEEKPDYSKLKGLFAPTSVLQEISIDNGWADAFISLAERFDSATLWRS